jgi:hypothetical protein
MTEHRHSTNQTYHSSRGRKSCLYVWYGPDDVLYKIQHITKHYDKLETFVRNNDR